MRMIDNQHHGGINSPDSGRQDSVTTKKTIPFDYLFEFELKGERGNKVQDVVQISIEGVFISTSVGYSLAANGATSFSPVVDQTTIPHTPVLVPVFSDPVININGLTEQNGVLLVGQPGTVIDLLDLSKQPAPEVVNPDGDQLNSRNPTTIIQSDGTVFVPLPLQNMLIRAWDRTNNLISELFQWRGSGESSPVIGHNPNTNQLPAIGDSTIFCYGFPDTTVEVFLLESASGKIKTITNDGLLPKETVKKKDIVKGRLKVSIEKGLSAGDTLLVRLKVVDPITTPLSMYTIPRPKPSTLTLAAISKGLEKKEADLTRGFRLNPDLVNVEAADLPLDKLSPAISNKIFLTGCSGAEQVSFLYTLDSVGTGREFQSKPIHNIAGLGIANGDRPFRPFAKPILFEPRSSIRIQIEELSGPPGKLFIVLQGYKILGTGKMPE